MSNLSLAASSKFITATLDLPGSKSISNRVLPLAALAAGISIIHNVPDVAEDVHLMLHALRQLGIGVEKIARNPAMPDSLEASSSSSYKIYGCSGQLPVSAAELFLGNSGTSLRFLTAILALTPGSYYLTGIARMKERPIEDLLTALAELGAQITCSEQSGFPPLQTQAFSDKQQESISISGKTSSQYLTGLLLALPLLQRPITLKLKDELISQPYVAITIAILKLFGVSVIEHEGYTIYPPACLHAIEYTIEPDASSASYFLAIGALRGRVRINNLSQHSLQGDKGFAQVLQQMGAKLTYLDHALEVTAQPLHALNINMQDMPDVAMTIAVLALFATGITTIHGIASWQVKETNRLLAMYTELTKLGAMVSYTADSITIDPPKAIKANVAIDTYNDHRIAMCFSLVAVAGIPIVINDYECVGKTFANYFTLLQNLIY